ncbi:hypothetical protein [Oryza sativa Japonica Group]|uniref:Uncharacterized protein n=1 Tax=Oryza sativa subsp. japonica TaxID=39947 RepID=Q5ZBQ2_ORYSJ|nr:hypothetical protein [Oryza sativa Japonica Group]
MPLCTASRVLLPRHYREEVATIVPENRVMPLRGHRWLGEVPGGYNSIDEELEVAKEKRNTTPEP